MADDYSKSSKVVSTGSLSGHAGASKSGGDNSGPTGSARTYPKGKGSAHNTDWNPMKKPASTYGICGV
jgi:hypothetical protein